jgi:hypothetical protein
MDIVDEIIVWSLLGILVVVVLVWVTPTFVRLLAQGEVDPESGEQKSVIDWGDKKPESGDEENEEKPEK